MSTYSDSKFVTARKEHLCERCRQNIEIGKEALAYKAGQRWTIYAHTECVMRRPDLYRCHAVTQRGY